MACIADVAAADVAAAAADVADSDVAEGKTVDVDAAAWEEVLHEIADSYSCSCS